MNGCVKTDVDTLAFTATTSLWLQSGRFGSPLAQMLIRFVWLEHFNVNKSVGRHIKKYVVLSE